MGADFAGDHQVGLRPVLPPDPAVSSTRHEPNPEPTCRIGAGTLPSWRAVVGIASWETISVAARSGMPAPPAMRRRDPT